MIVKIPVAPPAGVLSPTNAPELSVSELSNALKRTVEDRFGYVRVRGEISNFRGRQTSGHAYFSLKDANARLDAVIWKTSFAKLKTKPEDGLEVIACGRITTFPGKSSYQIVIDTLEPAGVGALMALLEERRKKFLAEGLFDAARKRPIPFLPAVIGVITSPTGAVIRDILHRLQDRFPRRVIVWPVRVQGDSAANEVAAAIAGFDALSGTGPLPRPNVLIVARGGGSLEDLWSFNEEIVVRAVAACRIPLIAAVGHETDTTLVDFVADLRAPTPTGAAEKCVPVRAELLVATAALASRKDSARRRWFDRARGDLRGLSRALPTRESVLALPRQRSDRMTERLDALAQRGLATRRAKLAAFANMLSRHTPVAELRLARRRLDSATQALARNAIFCTGRSHEALVVLAQRQARASETLMARIAAGHAGLALTGTRQARAWRANVDVRVAALDRTWKLIESLGYKNVLARGFALVRRKDDTPVKFAAEVKPAAALTIQFADAAVDVRAEGAARPFKKAKPTPAGQGSLF